MEKMVLVYIKNLILILVSIRVVWGHFLAMMFENFALPRYVRLSPPILFYKTFIHLYVILVSIFLCVKLFFYKNEKTKCSWFYISLLVIDFVVMTVLLYDIITIFPIDRPFGIILLLSQGIMIWHITDCISVLKRSKNDSPLEEL